MKASISLRQLRTDPREYIRLLQGGYEVEITEHRKVIATAVQTPHSQKFRRGSVEAVLEAFDNLPYVKDPAPQLDTPTYLKQLKDEYHRSRGRL